MRERDPGAGAGWRSRAEQVHAHLPRLHARFEALLAELVGHASVSAKNANLDSTAARLVEVMTECGLDASVRETGGAPLAVGSYHCRDGAPTLLVYGHYDVQPVEPLSAWHTEPFVMERRDGRFVGRGTADNKAQHLAQLMAICATAEVLGELPVNLHLVVEGQEEVGSPHLGAWLTANADWLRADLAYTSDGAIHPSGRPVIVCGARGLVFLDIELTVSDTDRHSGNFSGVARNAAQELVAALATLWGEDGRVLVPGFFDEVREVDEATRQAAGRLPFEESMLAAPGLRSIADGEEWFTRVLLEPSLNLAGIEAGWTGPGMKTVVPGSARAKLDARLVPGQQPDRVAALVAAHLAEHCPEVTLAVTARMDPSRTPVSSAEVPTLREAVAHGWGKQPLLYPNLAGSLPDAAFTRGLGIPSFIVPYGNADQANHAPNENMLITHFHAGAKVFASVLQALAERT